VSNLLLQRVAEGTQGSRIVVGLGEEGVPFFRLDDGVDDAPESVESPALAEAVA
jgi:hypothetical protein